MFMYLFILGRDGQNHNCEGKMP